MVHKLLLLLSVATVTLASPVRRDNTSDAVSATVTPTTTTAAADVSEAAQPSNTPNSSVSSSTSTPTPKSTGLPLLSQTLQVEGDSVADIIATVGDRPISVWTAAQQLAAQMSPPADFDSISFSRVWGGNNGLRVNLDSSMSLAQCQQPIAWITQEAPTQYCPQGADCWYVEHLKEETTAVLQYGWNANVERRGGALSIVARPASQLSDRWSSRDTTTTPRDYRVEVHGGYTCLPMSIQFSTTCSTNFKITNFQLADPNSGLNTEVCDIFNNQAKYATQLTQLTNDFPNGEQFVALLESVCQSSLGQVTLDIDEESTGPLVMMGCSNEL